MRKLSWLVVALSASLAAVYAFFGIIRTEDPMREMAIAGIALVMVVIPLSFAIAVKEMKALAPAVAAATKEPAEAPPAMGLSLKVGKTEVVLALLGLVAFIIYQLHKDGLL